MKKLAKYSILLYVSLDLLAVLQVARSTLTNTAYGNDEDANGDEEQHANVNLPWLPHCPSMCHCYRARHELVDIARDARGREQLKRRSPALRTVNCSHQNLVRFPEDIPPDVEVMLMDGNLLTGFAFHHGISQALSLSRSYDSGVVILNVSNNLIRNLQGGRLELPSLKTLDLSHNLIESIKTSNAAFFIPLRNLTTLNLSYNNINYIHSNVFQLHRLTTLDISGNMLKEFDLNLLEQLPAVRQLFANHNQIYHIAKFVPPSAHPIDLLLDSSSKTLNERRRQQKFLAAASGIVTVRRNTLDVLDLSFNRLGKFGIVTSSQVTGDSLSSLVISESLSFSPDLFSSLIQVRRLLLSGNPVQQIYANAFFNLSNLEYVELNNMPKLIVVHDHAFSFLPNLVQVEMRRNKLLQYIYDDAFNLCPMLAELNFSDCSQLINIPNRLMIEHVDRLQRVEITGTALSCAFNWQWLKEYFGGGELNSLFRSKVIAAFADDQHASSSATNRVNNSLFNPVVEPALCRMPDGTVITVHNASKRITSVLQLANFTSTSLSPQPEVIVLGSLSTANKLSNVTQAPAVFGERLELACLYAEISAGGFYSLPSLEWIRSEKNNNISSKQTKSISGIDDKQSAALHNERRLIIDPIMPFDNGLYECRAEVTTAASKINVNKLVNISVSMRNISFAVKVPAGASRATLYWNNSDVHVARYFSVLYQETSKPVSRDKWREICSNQDVVNFDPRSARGQHCKIGDSGGGNGGVDYELAGGKTYNVCLTISRPAYGDWLDHQKSNSAQQRLHHYISCAIVPIAHNTPSSHTLSLATAYEITVVGIAFAASMAVCVCCARCVCNVYWQHKLDRRTLSASSAFNAAAGRRPLRHSISLVMLENSFYSRTPSAPGTPVAFSNAGLEIDALRDDYDAPNYFLTTAASNGTSRVGGSQRLANSTVAGNNKADAAIRRTNDENLKATDVTATIANELATSSALRPGSIPLEPLPSVFVLSPPTSARVEDKLVGAELSGIAHTHNFA